MYRFTFLPIIALLVLMAGCKEKASDKLQEAPRKETLDPGPEETDTQKTILFFGNSLTAGYGLDPDLAFPALIQKRLDSLGYDLKAVNAGLSGDTTTSGLARLEWVLQGNVAIFVLELGANDGLRGIPLSESRINLQTIIDNVKQKNPETKILLAGMLIPPNMGPDYTAEFAKLFPDLAENNRISLIPFLLDGVAGHPELNLPDGIHPTAEGHKIVAENVWQVLRPILP